MLRDKTIKKVIKGIKATAKVYDLEKQDTEETEMFVPFTFADEDYIKRYIKNHGGRQVLELISYEEASEVYEMPYQEFKARMDMDMDTYKQLVNLTKSIK